MKKLLTVLILALVTTSLWADDAFVYVNVIPEGNGSVFITTQPTGDFRNSAQRETIQYVDKNRETWKTQTVFGQTWVIAYVNSYECYAYAYPDEGHYFYWKEADAYEGDESLKTASPNKIKGSLEGTTIVFDKTINRTAIFKEKVVYKDYAHAVAVIVDNNNKPLVENGNYVTGSCFVSIGSGSYGPTATVGNPQNKAIISINSNPTGEWNYTYNVSANTNNYEFLGWYEADAKGNLPLTEGKVGAPTNGNDTSLTKTYGTDKLYSQQADAPEAKTMYAVFRPKFFLYPYDAEEDKFEDQPMNSIVVDNISQYTDRPEEYRGGDLLYKIVHRYESLPTVCSFEGDFTAKTEQIQGLDVLRVTPSSNADELTGTVSLCLNGNTKVVQLTVEVSNTPIYVTLNPAVDLLGTYTYTQNTTGAQQFEVTTTPIQKKMTTSSDYAFTFNPSPRDPNKMMFEKWVIRDGEGNVIYESETANLTYRFSGGESIAPVFTSKDRAIFIVKSEPNVKYLKLQEALNRASSLKQSTGQNQVVTVYMTDPPKGQTNVPVRLVQGEYTIENGVTFLIPGESSFAVLEAPNEDNFTTASLSRKCFCSLVVDDNTRITVKNGGKISLYALMGADQGANGTSGKVFNHGHLQLGKDCQITVNTGGFLYALGFITGDMSSHITMKTGSTVYEAFQFKDWRGGSVVLDMKDNSQKVYPVGQYYAQTVEVPMTLEWGAKEYLSTAVAVSGMLMAANVKFIDTYTQVYDDFDGLGLFALDQGTKLTKSYDPATDRLKIRMEGTGLSTRVKIGHLQLKMKLNSGGIIGGIVGGLAGDIDLDSKDYVMPIQNNMDVEVKNATINITADVAYMPGSVMRVYDDAVINVESGVRMYIYDGEAKVTNAGSGYWGTYNAKILPLDAKARPGGIQYTRTEADLVDARLIINGDMNIHGELYTVKGPTSIENGAGGDISSEGSGKINVYNIGTDDMTYQWHQSNGAQEVSLTTPYPLILHNDLSKQPEEAKKEYTQVRNDNNVDLKNNPLSYTYYQHDGTWRLPEAGITGIKLYDSNGTEIEKFLITRPDIASVSGYILATLEPMVGVNYQVTDFDITSGEYSLNEYAVMENGKLKIPVTYPVQNIHGDHTQTLHIESSESAEFSCAIDVVIKATEDYTPIFEVPTSLSIFGRINEPTNGALPIKHDAENVVVVTETSHTNPTNPKWIPVIEGAGKNYFAFSLGEDGNKLDGAKVIFTPNDGTTRNATLKLKAIYTDKNGREIPSKEHSVTLVGNGLMTENTLDFNNVGTITTKTNPFELLAYINSEGKIYYDIVEGAVNAETDAVIAIEPKDANDVNGNYWITPKKVGQVKIRVYQEGTNTHTAVGMTYNNSTGKWEKVTTDAIEKTIVVVADPGMLTDDNSCIEDEADFQSLTADRQNVELEYDGTTNPQIKFTGATSSTWMAQFSNMPGVLTFTPSGDGYWAIQESNDGVDWTETTIWWTQLPSGKPVTVALRPTSRRVQISYFKLTTLGVIEELCIKPFAIHSDVTKIYVPVVDGKVQRTEVVFTHTTPAATISEGPTWATAQPTTGNLGGVLNTYYQTTIVLEGGTDVAEWNNGYTLTVATYGLGVGKEVETSVLISTYNFPKELPMQSSTWVTNPNVVNINNYDESEHYYWYMTDAEYVKWDADAERKNVVFLNKGNDNGNRSVTFGYEGLPSEVRFQSLSSEWKIEESIDGGQWDEQSMVVTQENGLYTIKQPILHTSKRVRITYIGTDPNEILLSNLVIEGFPSAVAEPTEVEISKGDNPSVTPSATFNIHVMNLDKMQLHLDNDEFKMSYQDGESWEELENTDTLDNEFSFLAMNKEGNITIKVEWKGKNLVNEGYIKIINPDQNDEVMATVRLVGKKDAITLAEANTGIWTGVPDGVAKNRPTPNSYTLVGATGDNKVFDAYPYHEVNIKNAFDVNGNALFNYVVIYGETTTKDGSRTITRPTSTAGSNAKTPYYIYERDSIDGKSYRFVQAVEDANSPYKADLSEITHFTEFVVGDVKYYAIQPKNGDPLSFYMTGFCPYATTGSTKDDEGVWYFRGDVNDQVHIYLEDCHLYSRTKSLSGHNTSKTGEDSPDFTEDMVKGSGAVLVFENANPQQNNDSTFNVAIHTRGHNILKSNYGCYYTFLGMAKATQISSPVQVRLGAANHFQTARTTLDFDDLWPLSSTLSDHTNGFLSLQKQANNAPSIDLGNANTIVNFRGGQIQLQNAQVGSPNYKTTLAISYRSGLMGNVKIQMAYGIGTDDVGGTVNFYDGTTTVLPMKVDAAYRSFYLMDTETLKDQQGNDSIVELPTTSCLRTPTKTYVYGGSHCMMRACNHVTSKGGAPKDGPSGQLLGRYVYNNTAPDQGYDYRCVVAALPEDVVNYQNGYEVIFENKKYVMEDGEWNLVGDATFTDPCYLVTPTSFPGELTIQSTGQKLLDYYENYPNGEYGLHSISPDANGNLSFWVPAGVVPGVSPEQDKQLTGWKACMTEIVAGAFGITGSVGGDVSVEFNEEVTNLLYCQLDDNIYSVISDRTKIGVDSLGNEKFTYNYKAPVVDPTGQLPDSLKYQYLPPTHVGDSAQYRVFSEEDYTVTNYLYYITTAQADKWMNFTMPFDVDTIWVVEAYSETEIVDYFSNPTDKKQGESNMQATLRYQAKHNADFAAFFGVAMAIGDDKRSFEDIYKSYIGWAKNKADVENGLYTSGTYDLRGKYPLTHYDGTNFQSSNFYLYHNKNTWYQTESDRFDTQWEIVPAKQKGKPLMKAGETYSLLFPYCLGCDVELDEDNNIVVDEFGLPVRKTRDYWDYWSGKFLIFQSTKASQSSPHIIKGSNYIAPNKVEDNPWLFDKHPTDPTQAILTGNSTFMLIDVNEYAKAEHVYEYISDTYYERYLPLEEDQVTKKYPTLTPTTTFLLNGNATRAKMVTREGKIIYDSNPDDGGDENQGTTTGGNIPTVGGGNDLFITSTATGINIAVAEPQQVRVMSATGVIIYSGMVQTAVDVLLPTAGVYVITGENEVHKILH